MMSLGALSATLLLRTGMLRLLPDKREGLAQAVALRRGEGGVFQRGLRFLEEGFHPFGKKSDGPRFVDELLDLADRGVVGSARAQAKLEETAVHIDQVVIGGAQKREPSSGSAAMPGSA